jgi:hypothetical protein
MGLSHYPANDDVLEDTDFVHHLSPFGNELIKHKLREERDVIHEIKITVLHRIYMQVFKKLYSTLC